jgi:hypothetical protein
MESFRWATPFPIPDRLSRCIREIFRPHAPGIMSPGRSVSEPSPAGDCSQAAGLGVIAAVSLDTTRSMTAPLLCQANGSSNYSHAWKQIPTSRHGGCHQGASKGRGTRGITLRARDYCSFRFGTSRLDWGNSVVPMASVLLSIPSGSSLSCKGDKFGKVPSLFPATHAISFFISACSSASMIPPGHLKSSLFAHNDFHHKTLARHCPMRLFGESRTSNQAKKAKSESWTWHTHRPSRYATLGK